MKSADELIIQVFAAVARPIMLRWMIPNSCIGATALTRQTLAYWKVNVDPIPTKLAVQVPSLNYAFVAGYKGEEKDAMKAKSSVWIDRGVGDGCVTPWIGHLVGLAAGRYLIDATLDQSNSPEHGFAVDPYISVVDLGTEAGMMFAGTIGSSINAEGDLDNRAAMKIYYERTDDESWKTSDAWNDESLPILAVKIVLEMHNYIRKGELW